MPQENKQSNVAAEDANQAGLTQQVAGKPNSTESNLPLSAEAQRQAHLQKGWDAMENNVPPPREDGGDDNKIIDLDTLDEAEGKELDVEVEDKSTKKEEPKKEDVSFEPEIEPKKEQPNLDEQGRPLNQHHQRDYTGFDPDDVPFLKRLPNHLFNKLSDSLKEVPQLKATAEQAAAELKKYREEHKLPEQWAEHPDAYQLTDTYKALQSELMYDEFEETHWEQQLTLIKQGKDWHLLKGYDRNTKQPVFELRKAPEDGKIDVEGEIFTSRKLQEAGGLKQQHSTQVMYLQRNHSSIHQEAVGLIKQAEDRFFPSLKDLTKLDADSRGNINICLEAIPPQFRNHPLASVVAKSYATIVNLHKKLKELDGQVKLTQNKLSDRHKAGPSPRELSGVGASGGGARTLDIKEFED